MYRCLWGRFEITNRKISLFAGCSNFRNFVFEISIANEHILVVALFCIPAFYLGMEKKKQKRMVFL